MNATDFEFRLILSGIDDLTTEVEDALYESGCDDAGLGMSCGVASLTFSRAAATLKDAVLSAIRDVRRADCGVEVVRVELEGSAPSGGSEVAAAINTALDAGRQRRRNPELVAEVNEAIGSV